MDTESPDSIQCETFLSRKLLLPPYFFPASSIHKPYSKKPPRSMSQSPPARNYPTPKKEFVDPARHLLVSALAQRDPQAPDASVESAKARIFSPRLRSKSQGLSAHRLAAAFVRKPPFPFLFFGSEPDNIFLDRKKRKHSTMLCLTNHDLAGGANCFKTTFVSLHCCCFSKDFLSA